MESAKGKLCPMTGATCTETACAWWCSFAQDCAVPLIAGILADSDLCKTVWEAQKCFGQMETNT